MLEQFIYGLCREDATREQADRAFRNLCERFFDWNEVRVSSTARTGRGVRRPDRRRRPARSGWCRSCKKCSRRTSRST